MLAHLHTSLLLCSHLAELCLYSCRLLVHLLWPEQCSHSGITLCLPAITSSQSKLKLLYVYCIAGPLQVMH